MRRLGEPVPLGRWGNQAFSAAAVIGCSLRRGWVPLIPRTWEYARWLSIPEDWLGDPGPEDVEFSTLPELSHIAEGERPYGQDVGLFADHAEAVRAAFEPSPEAWRLLSDERFGWWRDLCTTGDPVAIHCRRGDIVNLPDYQPVLTVDYYRRALELHPDRPVVAFSDDPRWVAEYLAPRLDRPIRVLSGAPPRPHRHSEYRRAPAIDWIDCYLYSWAPHHVLSNSTYSFWGAFLSSDPEPIYPDRWHGPRRAHIDPWLMFPPGWRRVAVE